MVIRKRNKPSALVGRLCPDSIGCTFNLVKPLGFGHQTECVTAAHIHNPEAECK